MAYLLGLLSGLIPAFSTGPVFLTLIQNAIDFGFKKTLYFIVGVAITDTSIILLTWFGLSQMSGGEDANSSWLSIGGGVLLIAFGLVFILKRESADKEEVSSAKGHLQSLGLFTQAIALNTINPIIWGFWAAISNYAITEFHDRDKELIFFAGILNMVWTTDLLKAYYAQRLKVILSEKVKNYIKTSIGLVLVILGLKMLIEYFV